jgi:hypothetical protein
MKLRLRKPTWDEKRTSVRLPVSGPVSCRRKQTAGWLRSVTSAPFEARMSAPSMFGMRLECGESLQRDDRVLIQVPLELVGGVGTVELNGEVVWCEDPGDGTFRCGLRLSPRGSGAGKWQAAVRTRLPDVDPTRKWSGFGMGKA